MLLYFAGKPNEALSRFLSLFQSSRGVSLGMAFFQVLKGCLSLYMVTLSASFFGAGVYRDAWVIGWAAQVFMFKLLFGPVNEILRAKFIHLQAEQGEAYAVQSISLLILAFSLVAIAVVGITILFSDPITTFFAPGYVLSADREIIAQMIRLLMPTLFLSELITILTSLLNAYKTYFVPELFSICSLLINIFLLLCLAPSLGIYTLVIANYMSAILLVVVLCYFLFRKGIKLKFKSFRFRMVQPYLLFALPFYISYTAGQFNGWAERALSTILGVGNTSVLDYARKFIDLPLTVIITITMSVMTPVLAAIWANEAHSSNYRKEFIVFIRIGLLIICPVVVLFIVCPQDIVHFFLLRGSFAHEWLMPASRTLFWFGLGLPGATLYTMSGQALIVQKKPALYAGLGVAAQLIPMLLNFLFYKQYGLPFFAVSWSITQYVVALVMFYFTETFERSSIRSYLQLATLMAITIFSCFTLHWLIASFSDWQIILWIGFSCFVIVVLLLYLLKMEEFTVLKRTILKLVGGADE